MAHAWRTSRRLRKRRMRTRYRRPPRPPSGVMSGSCTTPGGAPRRPRLPPFGLPPPRRRCTVVWCARHLPPPLCGPERGDRKDLLPRGAAPRLPLIPTPRPGDAPDHMVRPAATFVRTTAGLAGRSCHRPLPTVYEVRGALAAPVVRNDWGVVAWRPRGNSGHVAAAVSSTVLPSARRTPTTGLRVAATTGREGVWGVWDSELLLLLPTVCPFKFIVNPSGPSPPKHTHTHTHTSVVAGVGQPSSAPVVGRRGAAWRCVASQAGGLWGPLSLSSCRSCQLSPGIKIE